MTAADIDNLPDSDFAYIEPGGVKDGSGRTVPRSLRHFPIQDAAHVRNALARLSSSPFEDKARPAVEAAAKKMGIGEPAGKAGELKAEPFTSASEYDRWFGGLIPRRILMVPFGGEITSPWNPLGKARGVETPYGGMDVDLEFFHPGTDLYGPYPALKASRERVTDWHHRNDPLGIMGSGAEGVVIGKSVMDDHPETVNVDGLPYAGVWGDFWLKAGEKRRALVAMMERNLNQALYASTEPVRGSAVRNKANVHQIDVWPVYKNTITTSPQNGVAIMPALKAVLDADTSELTVGSLKALLTGLDATDADLRRTFLAGSETFPLGSDGAAKAGRVLSAENEKALRAAMDQVSAVLAKVMKLAEPGAEGDTSE